MNNVERGKRAAIYIRCSTAKGHTENQLPACQLLAEARGLDVIEVYSENVSAAAKERPEWARLKRAVHEGRISAIVVFSLDRVGRSMTGNLRDVLDLDRMNVELISVREPWLQTGPGPMRELFVGLLGWVASEERRAIVARCRAGQERARAAGKHVGRPAAVLDDSELQRLHDEGLSIRAIAERVGVSKSVVHRALQGAE